MFTQKNIFNYLLKNYFLIYYNLGDLYIQNLSFQKDLKIILSNF